jgi:hypothetical protein
MIKEISKKTILVSVSLILALVCAEYFLRYFHYSTLERQQGARELWLRNGRTNPDPFYDSGCTFSDKITAHPYFEYVEKRDFTKCGQSIVGEFGIQSRYPIPSEHDSTHFSILVLGGSVANMLAVGAWNGGVWLEDFLNSHYRSPNGKPFRVYNGAVGGWSLPIQNNVLSMLGDVFDGILAVDGYNEALTASSGVRIDLPATATFMNLIQSPDAPLGWKVLQWLKAYRRFCFQTGLANHSFLAFFVFERGLGFVGSDYDYGKFLDRKLAQYFQLPLGWPRDKIDAWNRTKYKNYIKMQYGAARAVGAYYAHFVQPLKEIDKDLTEEEKNLPILVSADLYKKIIVKGSEELKQSGIPSFLLVDAFKGEKKSIYADHVHYRYDSNGDSYGFRLVSERIGVSIGTAWHLSRLK